MTIADPAGAALASLTEARALVARTSTAERVADAVRNEVVEGRLRPGGRLPEQALSHALGVSRNTVREALSQLVAERVLVREPNRGVFVAVPDAEAVRDVYRARLLIEPAAVREGERAGDPEAVGRLRAAVQEGRAAAAHDDWPAVAGANQHFHRALVGLAGSVRLDQQMGLLLAEMRLVFHRMTSVREFHEPYLDGNDTITRLVEAGERERAAGEVASYLRTAEAQILAAFADL
ncbi:GntR family transcriptional regulator [Pseudonocardia kujensis]|uniref:GntR family transcriptional regulator n=1 Tax=Pseudonocardia kujensis TaxID=1128675 RepID=UPI001E3FB9EC|nr:GntR family transcriptional regulator [Pseudonocardia kujensis]MCE0767878.1 GntR family transcriptional regulator [Pseudonocardia kujensis]